MRSILASIGLMLLLNSIVGCSAPDRSGVSGNVTLDGTPLETGEIMFVPTEGTKGPTAGGSIRGGIYEVPYAKGAAVGRNRVIINSQAKTGRVIKSLEDLHPEYAEIIPAKYNEQSELVYELKPGKNEINIELHGRIPVEASQRK